MQIVIRRGSGSNNRGKKKDFLIKKGYKQQRKQRRTLHTNKRFNRARIYNKHQHLHVS